MLPIAVAGALLTLLCPAGARPSPATASLPASSAAAASFVSNGSLRQTTSHYEVNAKPGRLYLQGKYAGRDSAQGIVILDFGRPAYGVGGYGTVDFSDSFITMSAITKAVEFYIMGYFRYAPAQTTLYVAVGTNNSCGTAQPCGAAVCGCNYEPPDFATWGAHLAQTVEAIGGWVAMVKAQYGYTDEVRVVAGDDAEPAYDPGYTNTYALLNGYAAAVGGTAPAMVDYGSAEAHYWSERQLFQVAYGFPPDVAMPEVYYHNDAADWAALLRYAKEKLGKVINIYGVLAGGPGTNSAQAAYSDMLAAAEAITNQSSIPWLSTILPQRTLLPG